jgi:hypothetical protein
LAYHFPILLLLLLVFLIPGLGAYGIEALSSYVILLYSLVSVFSREGLMIWKKPSDRILLTEEMLAKKNLL